MKKLIPAALALTVVLIAMAPPAEARGGVRLDVGIGCCGYGYYPPGYGYYGYPSYYYVAPPPVVYVPPPAYYPPAPAPVTYAAPPSVPADQTSPTYTNENGQTCREYSSNAMINGSLRPTYGTACLQPDGSWRVVQ